MKLLFAMDIDGTSLRDNQTFSDKTLATLKLIEQHNHEYMFVTGRSREMVKPLLNNYGLTPSLILNNGHEILDIHDDSEEFMAMDSDKFIQVATTLLKHEYLMSIHTSNGKYILVEKDDYYNQYISLHDFKDTVFPDFCAFSNKDLLLANTTYVKSIEDVLNSGNKVLKIDAVLTNGKSDKEALEEIANIEDIDLSSSYGKFLEVCQANTNKALAIAKYLKKHNIDNKNVLIFGDGSNDLCMFETFENTYAPSNAKEIIKANAKEIIGNNNDDGVALFIEQIINNTK